VGQSLERCAGALRTRPACAAAVLLALLLAGCAGGTRLSVPAGGAERVAWVDRPAPEAGRRPLLIVLHAALLGGNEVRGELRLAAPAREAGIALAFPDAAGFVWNEGSLVHAVPGGMAAYDDIAFLDALIGQLVAEGTADPASIHLAGVSSGGMMAMRYACTRAGRIASVAAFMATLAEEAEQPCRPARPLPVMLVAGTADPVVRWDGTVTMAGLSVLQRRMSVPGTFAAWQRANRCAGVAPPRQLPRRGTPGQPDVLLHEAAGCARGVPTRLYEVRGGGHRLTTGGDWTLLGLLGRSTPDIEPGELLLDFVREVQARR
jgi:polyhydroxybutyrate depolymerase